MKIHKLFLIATLLSSAATGRAEEFSMIRNDFSDSAKTTGITLKGGWKIADGVLKSPGAKTSATISCGAPEWSDYELEFKVRRIEVKQGDQHFGVRLRFSKEGFVQVYSRGDTLIYMADKRHTQLGAKLEVPFPAGPDAPWTTMLFIIKGDRLTVKINGKTVGEIDRIAPQSGTIEFYNYGNQIEIDDLSILLSSRRADSAPASAESSNILFNSGFEECTNDNLPDYWGVPHWGISDPDAILNRAEWVKNFGTDTAEAFEGKRSMRIHNPRDGVAQEGLKMRSCNMRSKPAETYTLSAWLKSDVPNMEVQLGNSTVKVSTQWKRYTVKFVNSGKSLYHDMVNLYPRSKGTLWADAVQLEPGENATDYRPAAAERRLLTHEGNEKKIYMVPQYASPHLAETVNLDGRLDEPVWSKLPAMSFGTLSGTPVKAATEARVWYDDNGLYIGVKCMGDVKTQCAVKEHDGNVWNDPSLEIFLDSQMTRGLYHHLAVNRANTRFDSYAGKTVWNGDWKSATHTDPAGKFWSAELFIPFGELGLGLGNEDKWGLNIGRNAPEYNEVSCWAPTYGGFHNPLRFGQITVDPKVQQNYFFRVADAKLHRIDARNARLSAEVVNDSGRPAELRLDARTNNGAALSQSLSLNPGERRRVELGNLPIGQAGEIPVTLDLHEKELRRATATETVSLPDYLSTQIQFGASARDTLKLRARAELATPGGSKIVASIGDRSVEKMLDGSETELELPIADLPPGPAKVCVKLQQPDGTVLAATEHAFTKTAMTANMVEIDRFARMTRVNGELYMPLGIFWEGKLGRDVIAHLATLGCNSVNVIFRNMPEEEAQEIFDAAAANGILIRATVNGRDFEQSAKWIERFKNHPALLVWDPFDEIFTLDWGKKNYPAVVEAVRKMQELDPNHPVITNENKYGMGFLMSQNLEFPGPIVSIDNYAYPPSGSFEVYGDLLRTMGRIGRAEGKPSWIYLLGAGYAFHASRDHTPEEHEFMAYSTLINGSTGLYYFASYPKSSSALAAISQIFREFKTLTPVIGSTVPVPTVNSASPQIEFTTRILNGELYVIAVNKSRNEVDAKFDIGGFTRDGKAEVLFENRQLPVNGGMIADRFKGFSRHVYKCAR